ncbi:hypothetical protein [Nonomuraea typhae]|uniref:hypothetical protein n=1 Tax=Nonomuraea typhae TaxID=2603600 RepID=UPI0012FB4D10|nr:hypothetical protein [Nonomuraea typhae]
MTPEQLHAALEEHRLAHDLTRWELTVDLDCGLSDLRDMRMGRVSANLRDRAEEWLRRKQNQPRKE